jgi:A/G-specific adenine glycosylase
MAQPSAPASPSISGISSSLLRWFERNARDLPWRRTRDPYAIWISEVMLQQTQVRTVIPYFNRWMRELPTLDALAKAGPARVLKLWEGLGYYSRARNLHLAAQHILHNHGGIPPNDFNTWLQLPGVGRYTAGAICSIACNQPTPILDGNVIRVLTRVFAIHQEVSAPATRALLWTLAGSLVRTAARLEQKSKSRFPNACSHLNQALMELGALICKPLNPDCAACPLKLPCLARATNRVMSFPNSRPRPSPVAKRHAAFAVQSGRRYWVRERPAGGVNPFLWEFPCAEDLPDRAPVNRIAASVLRARPVRITPLFDIRHSITRHRIHLKVFKCLLSPDAANSLAGGRWLGKRQLNALPFTAAHGKILKRILTNTGANDPARPAPTQASRRSRAPHKRSSAIVRA